MNDQDRNVIDFAKARRNQNTLAAKTKKSNATKKHNRKHARSAHGQKAGRSFPRWLVWLQFVGLLLLVGMMMKICAPGA